MSSELASSSRRFRVGRPIALLVVLVLTLSGCYWNSPLPGVYDKADAVAAELDLDSLGTISIDEYTGGNRGSGPDPSYLAVVSGEGLGDEISSRLKDAGFIEGPSDVASISRWERGTSKDYVQVVVRSLSPGDQITIDHDTRDIADSGIAVTITTSR